MLKIYDAMDSLIRLGILIGGVVGTIMLLQSAKAKVAEGQSSQEPLTKKEKIITWIVCIINPIIAGAILYFGWKKRLPVKANQANKISFIAFFIFLMLGILGLFSLTSW